MQHQQVNKVLKKLEVRKLVQPVKSVTSKNKKMYIVYGLEPSRELTGGSWYSGSEFDHELITQLGGDEEIDVDTTGIEEAKEAAPVS